MDETLHEQNAAIKSAMLEEQGYLYEIEKAEKEEFTQLEFTSNMDDELEVGFCYDDLRCNLSYACLKLLIIHSFTNNQIVEALQI